MVTTPGEAFDAPGFIRVSYANSLENLEEALQKMGDLLAQTAAA